MGCSACDGKGYIMLEGGGPYTNLCAACEGRGVVMVNELLRSMRTCEACQGRGFRVDRHRDIRAGHSTETVERCTDCLGKGHPLVSPPSVWERIMADED